MGVCETCGNDYENTFEISVDDEIHEFDCFECAIQALAPNCAHCDVKIVGHGFETDGEIYCCGHCAREDAKSNANIYVETAHF